MRIPVHIAKKIWQLSQGEIFPANNAKHPIIEELIQERIIERNGRVQKKLHLVNPETLFVYLQNKYGINDLKEYIEVSQNDNVQRSDLVAISSDSKLKQVNTFKGFLVNSFTPVQASLSGKPVTLNFTDGIFQFIYDFENFIPDQEITIVGIENPENFRFIEKQKHLFKNIQPLFVSRYPQYQSKHVISWLQSIPNNYLHFGDYDFAGIGIYVNEYKKYLPEKSAFFVPENIEELINTYGNRKIYNEQRIKFKEEHIIEEKLLKLIALIHKYKKRIGTGITNSYIIFEDPTNIKWYFI